MARLSDHHKAIIAAMQHDPAMLFSLSKPTDRIMAYLSLCTPAPRTGIAIRHGARVYNPHPYMVPLIRRGVLTKVYSPEQACYLFALAHG